MSDKLLPCALGHPISTLVWWIRENVTLLIKITGEKRNKYQDIPVFRSEFGTLQDHKYCSRFIRILLNKQLHFIFKGNEYSVKKWLDKFFNNVVKKSIHLSIIDEFVKSFFYSVDLVSITFPKQKNSESSEIPGRFQWDFLRFWNDSGLNIPSNYLREKFSCSFLKIPEEASERIFFFDNRVINDFRWFLEILNKVSGKIFHFKNHVINDLINFKLITFLNIMVLSLNH